MKIEKLVLRNFMGDRHFELETDGLNINIFGDNETGKSTKAHAIFWCLFGKDADGKTDFDIKPNGKDGLPTHNLNHSVELTLGNIVFTRTYREVYTKQRGSSSSTFTGHTTDYLVDGVEKSKGDYDAAVSSICPDKVFRLLTDPKYFASLKWEERRKMLLNAFCSDITDDVVIASSDKLKDLPMILDGRTPDDRRSLIVSQSTKINEELKEIPARIDEATRSMPDAVAVPDGFEAISKKRSAALDLKAELRAGGGAAAYTQKIADAQAAVISYESARLNEYNEKNSALNSRRNEKLSEIGILERTCRSLEADILSDNQKLGGMDADLTTKRAQLKAFKERQHTEPDKCAACGQALPADEVAAALNNFNEQRATTIATMVKDGKALVEEFEAYKKIIEAKSQELADTNAKLEQARRDLSKMSSPAPFKLNTTALDYCALTDKVKRLEDEKAGVQNKQAENIQKIEQEIEGLESSLAEIARAKEVNAQRGRIQVRIDELTELEVKCGQDFEILESHLFLLEEFIRAKVSLVTDRINSQFEKVRFKLFETQVNGGVSERCDILYPNKKTGALNTWGAGLNTGGCINAGLEIIDTMAKALGAEPLPIILDGAESVTEIRPTAGQQIRLIVSAGDKELRVVTEGGAQDTKKARKSSVSSNQSADYNPLRDLDESVESDTEAPEKVDGQVLMMIGEEF